MNTQKIKLATTGLLLAFSLGCGSSKEEAINSSNSSHINSNSQLAGKGKCSIDMDGNAQFGMKLKSYEDATWGYRSDLVLVQMIRFPSDFGSSDQNAIQLWTRTIDASNNWGSWKNSRFYLEAQNSSGQKARIEYAYQDLTWQQMKVAAQYFGFTAATPQDFFNRVRLMAQLDSQGLSKILTAKIYYATSSNSPEITALAPLFDANPKTYAEKHPSSLVALHPLQSLMQMNYTTSQYEYEIEKFCF